MFKFVVLSALVACALGAAIPDGLLPQLDGRIVGGSATTIDLFPYQVSLQRSGSHACGASIYTPTIMVTAAHCMQNVISVSSIKIRAGSTSRSSGGTLASVASYKNNEQYNANTMVNDISIIKLSSPLTLGTSIQTIPLATTAPATGTPAVVSGWGTTSSGGSSPKDLRFVNVNIVDREVCASRSYGYGTAIKLTMICATESGKDACQGDSGGPLVAEGQLAGVVSWGYGCADSRYPGVYSDVAALHSWVVANI